MGTLRGAKERAVTGLESTECTRTSQEYMTEIRREGGNLEERDEPRGSGCLQTGSDGDFLLLPHAPLAQNHEVAGSIPGTSAILNMD